MKFKLFLTNSKQPTRLSLHGNFHLCGSEARHTRCRLVCGQKDSSDKNGGGKWEGRLRGMKIFIPYEINNDSKKTMVGNEYFRSDDGNNQKPNEYFHSDHKKQGFK